MSGYIGATPVPQSIQTKQTFTATASQTTFGTTGYSDGTLVDVHLNGVLLVGGGVDYTATNGSDIVLTTGASAGDTLEFSTFSALQLSDQVFNNSITLQNPTEEDTDGGRESTLIFKGEQSGGEKTTLAEIEASHDGASDDQKGDLIFRTNDGSDGSAPTEAMRIDSAQNLLVGTTDDTLFNNGAGGNQGVLIKSSANIQIAKSGSAAMYLNRLDSDGEIQRFSKDGTTIGSIGTTSSRMFTGTGDTGLFFNDQVDSIDPWNTSTNAARDGAIDLGDGSRRFKDLYLSGGAYLGGTAAANKLQDFEEASWTPTLTCATGTLTHQLQQGWYQRIGNMVHINSRIRLSSKSGASGQVKLSGLPFTVANRLSTTSYESWSNTQWDGAVTSAIEVAFVGVSGTTTCDVFIVTAATTNNIGSVLNVSDLGSAQSFRIYMTYFTS
jgi:hypothetical protein